MKSLTPLIFFFICSNLYAYQPKLMLLGALENKGESFIDVNAHQKIRDSFKQAVIYEKYAHPIKDEQGVTYQSVIKQLIVDCTGKTIAIRGADYFIGKTSNSTLVKKFDDITLSHDGETGAAFYSFDDLEFKALNQDKFYNKIYVNTCK